MDQAWRIIRRVAEISYKCEEARVVVRTDALIGERPIVGWVLDDLEAHLGTACGGDFSSASKISPFLCAAPAHLYRKIC